MSEARSTQSGPRTPSAVTRRLDEARGTGGWMVGAGIGLAVLWWVAVAVTALGALGLQALSEIPRALIIGAALAAAVPGALMIMAGYMARANRRASAANDIVMEAAARLLTPAQEAGEEGVLFAEQMKQAAAEVDRAMAHAISAMKAMAGEIGDERMRLESVSYASADNARDLTTRLAGEREALESLARDLKSQIGDMNEAIPRQATLMVNAAKQAGEEVARADEALEARLAGMKTAGEDLARKLRDLDELAKEASSRTEGLTFAVSRVEEKLEQSRRTVDDAVRASEVAAAAAATTGDALKDAVSSALDGARLANSEINQSTRAAAEETARTLAELRIAGQAAASAIESAGRSARSELHKLPGDQSAEPAPAPEVRSDPAPATNGRASDMPKPPIIEPAPAPAQPIAADTVDEPALRPRFTSVSDTSPSDAELFDASADALAAAALNNEADAKPPLNLRRRFDDPPLEDDTEPAPHINGSGNGNGHGLDTGHDETTAHALVPVTPQAPAPSDGEMGWRDILSDIDRENAPLQGREEIADALLERLQDSGIRLPEAFRPKAKRKIATAARNGDVARRNAINDQVGKQVDRVAKRLKADRELMHLARQFHVLEEEDALNALEQTQKTNRNCSARLAAYLLLDAAGV